jgi:hypothetical protein
MTSHIRSADEADASAPERVMDTATARRYYPAAFNIPE